MDRGAFDGLGGRVRSACAGVGLIGVVLFGVVLFGGRAAVAGVGEGGEAGGAATGPSTTRASKGGVKAKASPVPAYTAVRWDEDYSYLSDPSKRSDVFDPVKFVPLGGRADEPDQQWYASVGGQLRYRYEYFNNNTFGVGRQDEDGYVLSRYLLHVDVHAGRYLRFFAMGKSALEDGRDGGPRSGDRDELEPQQLFVDGTIPLGEGLTSTVRFGRQEMVYGSQRLIGLSDWSNVRRNFDGLRWMTDYKGRDWSNRFDALLVRPVLLRQRQFANDIEGFNNGDGTQTLWGFFNTTELPRLVEDAKVRVESYFLVLNQQANTGVSPGRPFDSDTYTVGARVVATPRPFDLEVEGAYQFGTRGANNDRSGVARGASGDISAAFFSTEAGVTFEGAERSGPAVRPYLGFDYATGDGNRTDRTYSSFNQYFPAGHRFLGEVDAIGRANIVSPTAGVDVTLVRNQPGARRLAVRQQYLAFFRASDADTVVQSNGNPLPRPAPLAGGSLVGQEVDVILSWQVDRHLVITGGYSHLFAGDYIRASAAGNADAARDIDFVYLQSTFTF